MNDCRNDFLRIELQCLLGLLDLSFSGGRTHRMSLVDPPSDAIPSRAELRRLLDVLLPGDNDLNGFVYDHFPSVLQRFQPGLSRNAKLDLLLTHSEVGELHRRLRERGLHQRKRRASEIPDFGSERARHAELYGREDLLATLVAACQQDGWVVVSGAAGVGKTALLVHLLNRLEQQLESPVPHHFLRRTVADSARPGVVLRSLSAQIEARFPRQADPEAPPELRLIELLRRVSQGPLAKGGRLILMVDGLDEAEAEGMSNPLPRFLPSELPPNVTLVCSVRPRYAHYGWLTDHASRQLVSHFELDGAPWNGSSFDAVMRYFGEHGQRLGLDADYATRAAVSVDGNLLYAVKLREHLEGLLAQGLPLPRAEHFPSGLRQFLARLWDGLPQDVRAGLALLCAARQSLPLPLLGELLGWKPGSDIEATFLRLARPMLYVESAPAATLVPGDCVRYDHIALRDWVEEQIGPTSLHQSRRQVAAALCAWPPLEDSLYGFRRLYALRHAITQHAETGAIAQAEQVAGTVEYLIAKCQEFGSAALAEDLEHAAAGCTQREPARTFAALAQALRVGAHWLRQDPGALPGLLYNLLRCANWSSAAIERVLHYPVGRLRFRLRFPLQRRDASVHTFAGHWDSVVSTVTTPDGKRLISVSLDRTLRLWDLNSGAPLMHFYGCIGTAGSFVVTADGQSLIYATDDHCLVMYDLNSGTLLRRFRGHTSKIGTCLVTPDGQLVISSASDSSIRVWRVQTGEQLALLTGHQSPPSSGAVTKEGRFLVTGSWDHTLRVWDLKTGRNVRTLQGHTGAISGFAITADGKYVVSSSWDHTLRLWDLTTGVKIHVLVGHTAPVNGCTITPDGRFAVSASDDHSLKVWDLQGGRELRTLFGHSAAVKGCVMSPDGKSVISVSEDATLRQWDISTGTLLRTFAGHIATVSACAVAPDGRQLISASEDRTLKLWDLSAEPDGSREGGHVDAITGLWLSPDGLQLVSASEDRTVKLWDLLGGAVTSTIFGHEDAVTALAGSPDGKSLVTVSADRTVAVWDLQSGAEKLRFATTAAASGEQAKSGSAALAFPSDDHMIELWGMPMDGQRSTELSLRGRVRGCAVTPDGKHLVTGSSDKLVRLWDLRTGAEVLRFVGHTGSVNACEMLPDGQHLITAAADKTLVLWDLRTGTDVMRFFGHTQAVDACAVSADGRRLLSGGHDKSLRLWDLQTGAELLRLSGHIAPVTGCAFSSDGKRAVSSSLDYTLKLWELHSGMCLETIYGSAPFLSVVTQGDWLCAGDQAGNVWMLRDMNPQATQTDHPASRQSLVESIRKLLSFQK